MSHHDDVEMGALLSHAARGGEHAIGGSGHGFSHHPVSVPAMGRFGVHAHANEVVLTVAGAMTELDLPPLAAVIFAVAAKV